MSRFNLKRVRFLGDFAGQRSCNLLVEADESGKSGIKAAKKKR